MILLITKNLIILFFTTLNFHNKFLLASGFKTANILLLRAKQVRAQAGVRVVAI